MSDDVKILLVCLGLPVFFAMLGLVYFAWQDLLLADATKNAIEAQKEVYLNMPDKCKECPYCKAKEDGNERE